MSQNSLVLPTTGTVSGLQMTQNTNNALDTLNTLSSGASAPSSPEAGQFWHDTGNNVIRIRDLANSTWIAVGALDETNKLFTPYSTTQTANNASNFAPNMLTVQNSMTGGGINRFRNGTFDIAQRGTSGTVTAGSTAYTLDGWILAATGANIAWGQGYSGSVGANILNLSCASGITAATLIQRIESIAAIPLAGKQVTVQFAIYNNSGASFTPMLNVKHAASADNWTSPVLDVGGATLQSCPNGTTTVVAYTFTANANTINGLDIELILGGALNQTAGSGVQVQIGKADIRATPGVATGLNNNPPIPELRHIQAELAFCQRYYNTGNFYGVGYGVSGSGTGGSASIAFQSTMRTAPTVALGSLSYVNCSGANVVASYANGAAVIATANSTANTIVSGTFTASAEL